jgi:MFS family permease
LACLCSGLLFLARGSFLPYFFPLYQGVSGLDYAATAVLLNFYLTGNSLCSPFVGLLVDRWSPLQVVALALGINLVTLLVTLSVPTFPLLAISVALLGGTFTMARVAFNKQMIAASSDSTLRRSVSIRAMLMTAGSFAGNVAGAWFVAHGYKVGQVLLVYSVFAAAWLLSMAGSPSQPTKKAPHNVFWAGLPAAISNRAFRTDALRLCVALLPYGCWGTIIPKYVLDRFADPLLIPAMYACSTAAVVALTYVFNEVVSPWCDRRRFQKHWWPYVAAGLFLAGLVLIAAAPGRVTLCLGALAFGLGEVVFTPCMDEAVKRNSTTDSSGTYIGLLQFTEGGARLVGSAVSLGLYGIFRASAPQWAWIWTIAVFLCASTAAIPFLRQTHYKKTP